MIKLSNADDCDSVVILSWSDWWNEPRSNRYHYATRFAQRLHVYFVQPDSKDRNIHFEPVPNHAITIVHVPPSYDRSSAMDLMQKLRARGSLRPLLWIYNLYFIEFVRLISCPLKVFHATEDYVSKSEWLVADSEVLRKAFLRLMSNIDLLVAVSEGVADSYRCEGFVGEIAIIENGCDFEFWHKVDFEQALRAGDSKIVFYQGAINRRVDFPFLRQLIGALPDWTFWFCGRVTANVPEWDWISSQPNVRYFGDVSLEEVALRARQSTVGIIPFVQDHLIGISLPLKAYEYVACGLPVVSVPIEALKKRPDLFRIEKSVEGFSRAIVDVAKTRWNPEKLKIRESAAFDASYNSKFKTLLDKLTWISIRRKVDGPKKNLLLLYDDRSVHVKTINEHIQSFLKYSNNAIFAVSATGDETNTEWPLDFEIFDAIVIHYSVRLSLPNHLNFEFAQAVANYSGPKVLFVQDEYDTTDITRGWIDRLGITAVFTNVPLDQVELVYPKPRFGHVDFIPTLTGYVPEANDINRYALPLDQRKTMIGYRGRKLPHFYGALGQEKFAIGAGIKSLAVENEIPVDIEVDDDKRIYGDEWYRFLGSCRATLGTESGANVFDHDGSLKAAYEADTKKSFAEYERRWLLGRDGEVRMNQVSPKIFEAIRLRTALILFEGDYSGVVQSNIHYIPLKKDFSNAREVFEKLEDTDFLRMLTDRAYNDVIATGKYSYEKFVANFDSYIHRRTGHRARTHIVTAPILAVFPDGSARFVRAPGAINGELAGRSLFASAAASTAAAAPSPLNAGIIARVETVGFKTARFFWRLLPDSMRVAIRRILKT